ncbi:phage-related protein [Actinocrispum wychmicini]|uniref:Phage-related protein n=1 Tax=Actinocrispum wychmicini TaxID=1213861 RepID=A0A4R2JBE6_9PSEU|nr:phage-related protein [Actinocrispum wychmicini]
MTGPRARVVDRVSVRVLPDTSKFASELRAQLARITRGMDVRIPVKVDTKGVAAAAARIKAELPRDPWDITPNFTLDLGPTERLIARIITGLHGATEQAKRFAQGGKEAAGHLLTVAKRSVNVRQHWRGIGAGITSAAGRLRDIKADGFYRNFLRVGDAIAGATSKLFRFGVAAGHALGRLGSGAATGAKNALAGIAAAIGKVTSALGNLGRTGLIALAVFGLAAPAIGAIATLLAGLPSLGAAAGAGFAAVALGMDGIKKAASQLRPQVDSLKASLSKTFEKGLTPVFKELGAVFPVLDKGLNQVAGGLIVMAKSFTDVVTSKQGLTQIQSILNNTGKFFQNLAPMVRDGTSAFLTLADAGAKQFGLLAGVLNTFAADFRAAVERVTSDGSFASGMQGLAAVVGSVLTLFVRLFEAGVRVMGQVGGPIATLITSLGDALIALMPTLASITTLFATVLTVALDALTPMIEALTPSFQQLADAVGTMLVGAIQAVRPVLVPLAHTLGPLLVAAVQAVTPVLLALARILTDLLVMALKAVQPILPPLIEFLTQLGQLIGKFLLDAFTTLQPLLQLFFDFLAQLFTALQPLLPALTQLATQVLQGLLDILTPLLPPLMQLAQLVFPAIISIVQAVIPVITQVLSVLGELIPAVVKIAEVLVPIFQGIFDIVQRVWPGIQDIIEGAMRAIKGVIDLVMGIITGDWSRAWDGIKSILSGAWELLKGGVKLGIDAVVALFVDLPGAILRALGNLGGLLLEAGKAILQGLWDGIKWVWNKVMDFFSSIGSWIADHKGPLSYDKRLLIPAGKAIMQGLAAGLSDGFDDVQRLVSGMSERLTGSFAGSQWGADWAHGIEDGMPKALRALDKAASAGSISAQWQAQINNDPQFGDIGDRVAAALAGWSVQLDGTGLARLVNKSNLRKARRG